LLPLIQAAKALAKRWTLRLHQ
ncbi:putative rTX toxin, partial [Vibrio parahaemolyticus 970107]